MEEEPSSSGLHVESGSESQSKDDTLHLIPCSKVGPLYLQDYQDGSNLPPYIESLLVNCQSDFHCLCIILHSLMVESGYVLSVTDNEISDCLQSKTASFDYTHHAADGLQFSMTCNPLGSYLIVNGLVHPCVETEETLLTMKIRKSDFISTGTALTDNCNLFKNLSKLSHIFKERISYKAVDCMRTELKLPPIHGLLSLFPELLVRICSHLDVIGLCRIAQTCQRLNEITSDNNLWRALFIRNFQSQPSEIGSKPWKELYKKHHIKIEEEKRQKIELERNMMDYYRPTPLGPYPVPDDIPPFPSHPLGMLGGDYDLDPLGMGGGRNPFMPGIRGPQRGGLPGNPLPGSRFDPIGPFGGPGGNFRPGRGGGLMDDDLVGSSGMPRRGNRHMGRGRRDFNDLGGFGGGFI